MACFQSDGICPLSNDAWNMKLMSGEISMLTFLRNLAGMSPGPVALLGFRCWSRWCGPSVLMVILFISGVELIPRSGRFSMSSSVKTEANCFYGLINPCIHRN